MNKLSTHRSISICFLLSFFTVATGYCHEKKIYPVAREGVLDLSAWNFEQDGSVLLQGQWEVYYDALLFPDDFLSGVKPQSLAYADIPGNLFRNTNGKPVKIQQGFATYRLQIRTQDKIRPLAIDDKSRALAVRSWLNGKTFISRGVVGKESGSNISDWYISPVKDIDCDTTELEIIYQVSSFGDAPLGLWHIAIGLRDDIHKTRAFRTYTNTIMPSCLMLFLFFTYLLIFLFRREERLSLVISIFCFSTFLHYSSYGQGFFGTLPFPGFFFTGKKAIIVTEAVYVLMIFIISKQFFPKETPRLLIITSAITYIIMILAVIKYGIAVSWKPLYYYMFIITLMVQYLLLLSGIFRGIIRGRDGAMIFFLGGISAFAIWLISLFREEISRMWDMGPFVIVAIMLSYVVVLSQRYSIAQSKIHQQREQLNHSDKLAAIGTLVSSVAHEINNPNNAIILDAESLAKAWKMISSSVEEETIQVNKFTKSGLNGKELFDEISNAIIRTKSNSRRINKIVEDLRMFARKDKGELSENVSINDVVRDAVNIIGYSLRKRTRFFTMELNEGIPHIRGNHRQLEQVVINILNNSRQALTDTSQAIMVITKYDSTTRCITVEVQDEGNGIDKKLFEQVGKPFFTTKQDGTGLGLSICKRILSKHGGTISIRPNLIRGTTVGIHIPEHIG